ncbi:glycosyl hydrolase family 28 [Pedobacter psychrotolerans]|uniref:Endopolygalacturonase n=1 Tax=Pedobacter psychrotolerans TaxID=1843235 RepID=A0A4R2HC54_9SPHI|nr:glycoside hydrolase family 28 protein [Pedobacter psychrotolerans]TCO25157.1 glycosyl hydrolase family 28 [Pedobacter psychrotolerans]GGE47695.1 endopolygalacturonase [Pedobacter psychrotolerans]
MKFKILIAFLLLSSIHAIAQQKYNIKNFGAVGDGKTNDAKAIQKAIDACSAAGGGQVLVPTGHVFMSGPFGLKSFVELRIEGGAKILASPDEKLYTKSAFRENKGEGTIWIGGEKLEQVSITGTGILDGNGISFMGEEISDSYVLKPFEIIDPRPHLLTLIDCKKLNIDGVTFQNSAYWTVHLIGCNDVSISNITLLNSIKIRNSDGIDLDHSKNVRITNCYIESGDDCICLKNRREFEEYGACENIVISNCTMTSSSCAIKIGSENMDRISKVLINNCNIVNSNRGIGIQNRDEGTVSDVIFSNLIIESKLFSDVWWGKSEPIYITAYPRATANNKDAGWRLPKGQTKGKVGAVRDIYFSNIRCTGESGVYISAESQDKVSNIHFDQVSVKLNKTTKQPGGIYDRRPSNVEGLVKSPIAGFFFENTGFVSVNNSEVIWGPNKPSYAGKALEQKNVKKISVVNFQER